MPKEKEPATSEPDDADGAVEGVVIEPIAPSERFQPGAEQSAPAPDWTRRLSARGKLARASIAALAVIVVLVVVLPRTAFTLPPQIARLLTPAPTATPRPGRLIAGNWEEMSLPSAPGMVFNNVWKGFAADPRDGRRLFACTGQSQGDQGGLVRGEMALWGSLDSGRTWARKWPAPRMVGAECKISFAADGSDRMTLVVDPIGPGPFTGPACAAGQYFLSEDRGDTWRSLTPPTISDPGENPGLCDPTPTARHIFLLIFFDHSPALLERSDDGGLTWVRVGAGLPTDGDIFEIDGGASEDVLYALVVHPEGAPSGLNDLWRSTDAGATWRDLGGVGENQSAFGLFVETRMGQSETQLCHCVLAEDFSHGPPYQYATPVYLSQDGAPWTRLPNLPAPLRDRSQTGVYSPLGLTVDGKFVVLGADPVAGVPDVCVWAWDTQARRWEVSETPGVCGADPCAAGGAGTSAQMGADGAPTGTYVWALSHHGLPPGTPGHLYRLIIPLLR